MSVIHKRHVQKHQGSASPKKCKISPNTDGDLQDLKLKIERILNDYPASNKTCEQSISVVENCTGNYFTSNIHISNLNQTNLIEIPLITNDYKPTKSSNHKQPENKRNNLIYLTGAPKTTSNKSVLPKNNSDLSETDLQVLLQNFYKLEGEEQQMLISHLKKLEENKPDVVDKLKKFVRVSSPEPDDDTEFNDLDDLDDILEETDKLFTESEPEDDCVKRTGKEDVVPEKISEMLKKSAENSQKIKANLFSNQQIKNSLTAKKKPNIEKESPIDSDKDLDRTKIIIQKEKTSSHEKRGERRIQRINNFNCNSSNFYQEIDLLPPTNPELQAKYFGYRNYKEMQEYLEMTGIFCAENLYYSFSDKD